MHLYRPPLLDGSGLKKAVARVVVVLDYLFGLPVISGAVDVLEGRLFEPGNALCRPHHPLESLVVVCCAIAVPGGVIVTTYRNSCPSVHLTEN